VTSRNTPVSETIIRRADRSVNLTVGTSWTTSTTFRADDMAGLAVSINGTPSSNATVLTVFGANAPDQAFRELAGGTITLARLTDGTSFTGVSGVYSFPTSGWRNRVRLSAPAVPAFVRLVADAELGSEVSVSVSLKS